MKTFASGAALAVGALVALSGCDIENPPKAPQAPPSYSSLPGGMNDVYQDTVVDDGPLPDFTGAPCQGDATFPDPEGDLTYLCIDGTFERKP